MKIKSWHMGLIVLIVIFGGIAGTMVFNLWKTEGGGGGQGSGDGQGTGGVQIPVTFKVGEFAGEYNPADIRGSYSFGHISELWEIPLADLGTAFGLGAIEYLSGFGCRDLHEAYANLEEDVEIGTGSVKMFVALYTGLPYTLSDDEYLPQSAVELLKAQANLTEDQVAFLDTHSIDISGLLIVEPSAVTGEHEESAERIIKGRTTFKEVLNWGVPEEEIEAIIGEELPATGMTIRDFAIQKGLDFGSIKAPLQARVDSLGAE
ncbi:MAG: hypothetical protein WBB97_07385 [Dehalococcoidales bacterium]